MSVNFDWLVILILSIIAREYLSELYKPFCRGKIEVSGIEICSSCEMSYYNPSTNRCSTAIRSTTRYCDTYFAKSDGNVECFDCQFGYYKKLNLKSGKIECLPCKVTNCVLCDSDGKLCYACNNSLIISADKLICEKSNTGIKDCEVNEGNKCIKCNKGFAITEDGLSCEKSIALCIQLNENKECLLCENGSYLSDKGKCLQNHPMTVMSVLFFLPPIMFVLLFLYGSPILNYRIIKS